MNALLPSSLVLYFAGSCEPDPGGWATYGWVITNHAGSEVARGNGVSGCPGMHGTRTVAEYGAMVVGLRSLVDRHWAGDLSIHGDSKLVINQLNGRWPCNDDRLRTLRDRCFDLFNDLGGMWLASWIPRQKNARADLLSMRAYEEATEQPFPKRRIRT